jgi:hypothetical protein
MIVIQPGNSRWLHPDSAGPGTLVDPCVDPDWYTGKEGRARRAILVG